MTAIGCIVAAEVMIMKLSDQNWQDAGRIYEKTLARELDEMLEEREREEEREDDDGKND